MVALLLSALWLSKTVNFPAADRSVLYSPYNWYRSTDYVQSPNPGAYFKVGFTGSQIAINVDVSPLVAKNVPPTQYPVVRYSVDGGPGKTVQLSPETRSIFCADSLKPGSHTCFLQYVAGYVFLDFWSPVNVVRVTGFTLAEGAKLEPPSGAVGPLPVHVLFLGDSITNGDDDMATRAKGITNEVDTQDATLGYPAVVAAGLDAEYGVVAYGGASWNGRAADGHTPGLMTFASMLDSVHARLVNGKFSPTPDDIFINMGENAGPSGEDVPRLLTELRRAGGPETKIFVLIPFSGRSRASLTQGYERYRSSAASDSQAFLIDLGNNPYLRSAGPTFYSIDGQHPLANLHALLGAKILRACLRAAP